MSGGLTWSCVGPASRPEEEHGAFLTQTVQRLYGEACLLTLGLPVPAEAARQRLQAGHPGLSDFTVAGQPHPEEEQQAVLALQGVGGGQWVCMMPPVRAAR